MQFRTVLALGMDEVLFPFADAYARWRRDQGLTGFGPVAMTRYDFGAASSSRGPGQGVSWRGSAVPPGRPVPVHHGHDRCAIGTGGERHEGLARDRERGTEQGARTGSIEQ